MNSREAIAKLNVLSSYDTTKEKRDEYKECIYAIQKDLEILDLLKRHSGIAEIYSNVAKLGEHFVCEINDKQDVEKLKEWLKNDK